MKRKEKKRKYSNPNSRQNENKTNFVIENIFVSINIMDSLNIDGLSGNQIMFMINSVSGIENAELQQTTSVGGESSSGCSTSTTRKIKVSWYVSLSKYPL